MSSNAGRRVRARSLIPSLAVLVLAGALAATPAAATHGPVECADVMRVDEVEKGMRGTGYTVWRGTTPVPFDAEVLGVLENGIGPGRDLIVVDLSGAIIDQAGGIWYGMSGSPVYVGERLLGAVAFGLAWGPTSIGGLTPAEDMAKILEYPRSTDGPETAAAPESYALPQRISLPDGMARTIASREGTSSDASGEMRQLRVPVSISGLSEHAMAKVRRVIKREGLPLIPHAGSSASSQPSASGNLVPGGNFAAAISYGDITFAGIGTTTYVCNGVALAFGHPFFYWPTGATQVGANDADALAIVDDPTFGPYKLANVTERSGTVDQDRFAGVRALFDYRPPTIPITSTVTATELARTRDGRTETVTSEYTPFLAFIHLLANIDVTFDRIGEGTSALTWKIAGTREDGTPWELNRSNLYASEWDISYESVFELEVQLYTLLHNRFEEIEFTNIDVDATVEEKVRAYKISDVLVSKDGAVYKDVRRIRTRPGRTVFLRVELVPVDEDSGEERVVDLSIDIPTTARRDGIIEIASGASSYHELFCFLEGEKCADETGNKIDSFDELVAALEGRAKNNDLRARLRMGRRGRVKASDLATLDQVIRGRKRVYVLLGGGGEGGKVAAEPAPKPVD